MLRDIRHMRRRSLILVFSLVIAACSSTDKTAVSSEAASSDPDVTIILSPDRAVEFPVVGVEHPEARFEGGFAGESIHGPSYELGWTFGEGLIEVTGFRGGSEAFSLRITDRAVGAREVTPTIIRGETAHHFVDLVRDEHRFLWLEGPAVLELRATDVGERVDEVVASLVTLDAEALIVLTGGWKVEIDKSAPVTIGVDSVDTYSLADPARAIRGVIDPSSPSLDSVQGLEPHLWPWFSDRVPTPADAIGAEAFARLLRESFAGYEVLSASRMVYPGPDLQWRDAVLKMSGEETLQILTQLLRAEPTTVFYAPPGIRESKTRPGIVYANVVLGNRFLHIEARSTGFGGPLSLTADELLTIATELILAYDSIDAR